MQTIPQRFKETASRFPRRAALKFKYHNTYISLSFAELEKRVEILARGLAELGLAKNKKIAILSENRSEWVRTDLAALSLGAVTVPIHTTMSSNIVKHILNDSESEIILVSNQEQFNKLQLVISQLPKLKSVIYLQLTELPQTFAKQLLSLEEVMQRGEKSSRKIEVDIHPDDLAT